MNHPYNQIFSVKENIMSWLISETKQQLYKRDGVHYDDEYCIAIIQHIVTNNFPNCLAKYLEEFKDANTER